jgi:hypothetical protein
MKIKNFPYKKYKSMKSTRDSSQSYKTKTKNTSKNLTNYLISFFNVRHFVANYKQSCMIQIPSC